MSSDWRIRRHYGYGVGRIVLTPRWVRSPAEASPRGSRALGTVAALLGIVLGIALSSTRPAPPEVQAHFESTQITIEEFRETIRSPSAPVPIEPVRPQPPPVVASLVAPRARPDIDALSPRPLAPLVEPAPRIRLATPHVSTAPPSPVSLDPVAQPPEPATAPVVSAFPSELRWTLPRTPGPRAIATTANPVLPGTVDLSESVFEETPGGGSGEAERTAVFSGLGAGNRRSEFDVRDVPLDTLARCATDAQENSLKRKVIATVQSQVECNSDAGRYRFVEMRNLNAFLLWVSKSPDRTTGNRCDELTLALSCLQQVNDKESRG